MMTTEGQCQSSIIALVMAVVPGYHCCCSPPKAAPMRCQLWQHHQQAQHLHVSCLCVAPCCRCGGAVTEYPPMWVAHQQLAIKHHGDGPVGLHVLQLAGCMANHHGLNSPLLEGSGICSAVWGPRPHHQAPVACCGHISIAHHTWGITIVCLLDSAPC
jgi:hypothetical protein